jgi:hypothetical protein
MPGQLFHLARLCGVVALSCAPATLSGQTVRVPAQAPDTVPGWALDMANYTQRSPKHLKHTIGVAFHETATQSERQAAIEAVGGEVVGGWNHGGSEGLYLVRVKPDEGPELRALREQLRALPQVKAAIRILAISPS